MKRILCKLLIVCLFISVISSVSSIAIAADQNEIIQFGLQNICKTWKITKVYDGASYYSLWGDLKGTKVKFTTNNVYFDGTSYWVDIGKWLIGKCKVDSISLDGSELNILDPREGFRIVLTPAK